MAGERTRNWCFIAYPESLPDNWQQLLKATHIPIAISPLHTEPEKGIEEEIKPHYHIFLKFDSVKGIEQVKEITEALNATIPQKVKSPVGMIRYFVHKDDPDKQQFDMSDITVFNGFDISMYDSYTDTEQNALLAEIIKNIREGAIYEYCDLIDMYIDSGDLDMYAFARKNSYFLNAYITSRRHKARDIQIAETRNIFKGHING